MTSRRPRSAVKSGQKNSTSSSNTAHELSSSGLGRYITSEELAAAARRTREAATKRLEKG